MNKRDNNKYTFKTIMNHIDIKMLTFNFFNQGIITLLMLVSQCGLHIQYSHYFGRISNVAKKCEVKYNIYVDEIHLNINVKGILHQKISIA